MQNFILILSIFDRNFSTSIFCTIFHFFYVNFMRSFNYFFFRFTDYFYLFHQSYYLYLYFHFYWIISNIHSYSKMIDYQTFFLFFFHNYYFFFAMHTFITLSTIQYLSGHAFMRSVGTWSQYGQQKHRICHIEILWNGGTENI